MGDTFGKRLKKLREEREITQTELAKHFNVSPPSISQYEKDLRTPDFELLIKLADYYDVSIDYLLCRTDCKKINKEIKLDTAAAHRVDENDFGTLKNVDGLKELIRQVLDEEMNKK